MTAFVTGVIAALAEGGGQLLSKEQLNRRKAEIPGKRMQFAMSISLSTMNEIGIKDLCTRLLRARYVPSFRFVHGEEPLFILHKKIRKRTNQYERKYQ